MNVYFFWTIINKRGVKEKKRPPHPLKMRPALFVLWLYNVGGKLIKKKKSGQNKILYDRQKRKVMLLYFAALTCKF